MADVPHSAGQTVDYVTGKEISFPCSITVIEKDTKGLMWIGTSCGLRVYDGYEYLKVNNALDNLSITCMMADPAKGQMWIGTVNGMYVLDYQSLQIKKKFPVNKKVQCIYRGPSKRIYVVYSGGLLMTLLPDGQQTLTPVPELAVMGVNTGKILVEQDNGLLFITPGNDAGHYLYKLNASHKKATIVGQFYIANGYASYLEQYGNTLILAGWGAGVLLFDAKTLTNKTPAWLDSLNQRSSNTNGHQCFLQGETLYIYFQNSEIWSMDLKTGAHGKLVDRNIYTTLNGSYDVPFFVDEFHNIWFGQKKGLLHVLNDHYWFEKMIPTFPGLAERPSTRTIIEDNKGDIYIGSYSGLFRYRRSTNEWRRFSLFPGSAVKTVYQNELLDDPAHDAIYLGSETHTFYRFNKKTEKFENIPFKTENNAVLPANLYTFCMVKDYTGTIWLGTSKGLATYNTKTNIFTQLKRAPFNIDYQVISMRQSRDSNIIWAGSEHGLYKLDIRKGIVKQFTTTSSPALSSNNILNITQDKEGNVWMGTDNGLNMLSSSEKSVKYLNTGNSSLCDNTIYSMLWQNDNIVWLGTQRGLCKYNKLTGYMINYFVEDGIANNEFNRSSVLLDSKGKMYMGGITGITAFYPGDVYETPSAVKLFTSSINIWDNRQSKEHAVPNIYEDGKEIQLTSGYTPMTITVGISDYSDPDKNTYYYRIKGQGNNQEWISQGSLHVLKFTNLLPGNFTLEIKATNSRGIASSNILKFNLYVRPPFYQTWWFYMIILILVVLLTYFLLRTRLRNLRSMEQQRVKIASDLHDEIGGLVTRITVYSSSLKENYLSQEEQALRLDNIINVSQSLSTSIRDVLWTIDARNDKTSNLADYMMEHTQNQIRFTDIKLIFETKVDRDLKMTVFTRQQLYRIFKESINNILKHSNATFIKISYVHQRRNFKIEIENDGMKKEGSKKSHIGQGTRNIMMRAKSIGAIAETKASGTTFTVLVYSTSGRLKRRK